jgi:hypothetical protein
MRLNNWSIAASYGTPIFAGLGFGTSTASRSIISRRSSVLKVLQNR